MTTTDHPHTIDEALERFELIGGNAGDPDENKACVMTALSWVAGESWTDHPRCAHQILANLAIRTNDHSDTTPEQRAEIVRAGDAGIIDTWWLPGEVVAWCIAEGMKAEGLVPRCLATLAAVTTWKSDKVRPDLRGADLVGANLRGANLRDADLMGANLMDADLWGADLVGANLRDANLMDANLMDADLVGANLVDANLRGADLWGANLRDANLMDADLVGANLRDADLVGANLMDADLWGADLGGADCNRFTVPPAGWTVNTTTRRLERAS